jgi:hypothetical protein
VVCSAICSVVCVGSIVISLFLWVSPWARSCFDADLRGHIHATAEAVPGLGSAQGIFPVDP